MYIQTLSELTSFFGLETREQDKARSTTYFELWMKLCNSPNAVISADVQKENDSSELNHISIIYQM